MLMYYISHPYSNKPENRDKVEAIIRRKVAEDSLNVYISPIHAFGYLYNDVEYWHGMDMCLELLRRCDVMILCPGWELSAGCRAERNYAEGHGIPILTQYETQL